MGKKRVRALDVALLALAVIYFIGTLTFLKTCAAHDDGSWMTCHWAGQALAGVAALLCALAILLNVVRGGAKLGVSLAMIPTSALLFAIPGGLINLCMMDSMRCRSVTRPGAIVFGALIMIIAAVNAWTLRRAGREAASR